MTATIRSLPLRLLFLLAVPCLHRWQSQLETGQITDEERSSGKNASLRNETLSTNSQEIPPDSILVPVAFPLTSSSSKQELKELLEKKLSQSDYLAFVEFKLPERNLELPAYLLASPLRLLTSSQANLLKKEGGLEGLLYCERQHFSVISRKSLLGGALICALVQRHV